MILLSGKPGTGKSTAIKTLISLLGRRRCGGFYTAEIAENGIRKGFRTITLSGQDFVFSHLDLPKDYAIEDFGVDVTAFEEIALPELKENKAEFLIIDEIGPMQLYSAEFQKLLLDPSFTKRKVIATICLEDVAFTRAYKKQYPDLYIITEENRDAMPFILAERLNDDDPVYLGKLELSKEYAAQPDRFTFDEDQIILRSTHGVRTISLKDHECSCTCDYFREKGTCSHIMALIRMKKI